jgi:hypothetical protein
VAKIQQAAEWLREGKIVRRVGPDADSTVLFMYDGDWWVKYDGLDEFEEGMITLSDILAEDWELVECDTNPM